MSELNILLVDDQPAKLLTYEVILGGIGANLLTAPTARDALAHLLKDDVAVVLMDVNMPELDGFELAALIRQHPRCRRTAIIFVSAVHLTDVDRLRGYETGAVDYVSVPVVPEILRAKVGVFLDLYRKTAELERLNSTLEERVAARTAELEQSVQQLRASEDQLRQQREALAEMDRHKNHFLAMLAHELRNPLQPIRTAIEIARSPKISPPDQDWSETVIERQVNLLCRLVDDLLDASRISSGKLEVRKEAVKLAPILATAVDAVKPVVDQKRQRLVVEIPNESIELLADSARLTQVFFNLLNNAVKFTPAGGRIALTVSCADDIVVRVSDDGVGIAEANLERIFEIFFQGDTRADRGHGGLGLGLALVRQLVELHGGTVTVRSAGRNRGSEFCVRLPRTVDAVRAPAAPSRESVPLPLPRRILVVDDNRDAADSLALMLRHLGNEVDTEYDGNGAVAAFARFRPEVILMDLGMPRMDGYEAARTIRSNALGNDVTIIALTGWGADFDRERSRKAGFDRHLVKPVSPHELLATLSEKD
jgi:signal transduction histidine kinase